MIYYSNDIYPIALVLSYDTESVNKNYMLPDGSDLPDFFNSESRTFQLVRRTEEYYAMAVGIVFKTEITDKLQSHEGFHAACFIMDRLGVPLTESSEEAWAYLIGWIGECIGEFKQTHE